MVNPDHLEILERGVKEWNLWREAYPDKKPNFFSANLTEVDLRGADLRGAGLTGADLIETDLRAANLSGAVLNKADVERAVGVSRELTGINRRHVWIL